MKKIKYLLIIISLFLIGIVSVNAKIPETKNREELENLGVNKKWTITAENKDNVLKSKYVNVEDKIYDFSDVLTEEEYEKLKSAATEFKNHTNMEIVILIDNLPYSYDKMNEDYAADFYDYNDFGLDLDKYSGVLLFRNTYENDPYYDIYTFGNAQLYFSKSRLDRTLDNIYDNLHDKNYYSGFSRYISEMRTYYDNGIPEEMKGYTVDDNGYLQAPPVEPPKYHAPIGLAILIASVVSTIIIVIMVGKNKMVMKATQAEEYIDSKSINISNKEDTFISSHTTHYTTSSSSSSGGHSSGGSFHSSSGSSGGGHSSGGGRHG